MSVLRGAKATSGDLTALVHGEKGGVGKSVFCALLLEYLLDCVHKLLVVDADRSNPDIYRLFAGTDDESADIAIEAECVNLRDEHGRSQLLTLLERHKGMNAVVSLPAQMLADDQELADLLSIALPELNRRLIVFFVIDGSEDSINLLRLAREAYNPKQMIAVKNYSRGSNDAFSRWEGSNTRQAFLEGGGREIRFPKVNQDIIQATVKANPAIRFGNSDLDYGYRLLLRRWMQACYGELDLIAKSFDHDKR